MRQTLRNTLLLSLALSPGFFACASTSSGPPLVTRTRYLMGTMCEISARADLAQLDAAFGEIERVERLLSTWGASSALARLNAAPAGVPLKVDRELFELLSVTLDWAKRTDGAFNPLVGELISSWDLRGAGSLPDAATIEAGRAGARLANLVIDSATQTITRLSASTQFEEGAFGKGYAIDRAISVLRASGATGITIDFGGQIAAAASSVPTKVSIAHPEHRAQPSVGLSLSGGSLSTSSGSEKRFDVGGRQFSHIVDPRTGWALPPRGSASAIHDSALIADILSTALYVMGPDRGLPWSKENRLAALFLSERSGGGFDIQLSPAAAQLGRIEIPDPNFKLKEWTR